MNISVQSALPADVFGLPAGVTLHRVSCIPAVSNDWLKWFPSDALLGEGNASAGVLASQGIPVAAMERAETHDRPELFLMVSGTGTMLLQRDDGWALLRLEENSILRIEGGVPHYFGPSVTPQALCVVVHCSDSTTEYQTVRCDGYDVRACRQDMTRSREE